MRKIRENLDKIFEFGLKEIFKIKNDEERKEKLDNFLAQIIVIDVLESIKKRFADPTNIISKSVNDSIYIKGE